ncbi:tetratricopeptide repeat protein [soil metagenome]
MNTTHKNVHRHSSSDDTLVTTYYKAVDYFNNNKRTVYIALGAVAVIIAAIMFYTSRQKVNNEKAAVDVAKINPAYSNGNYNAALNGDSLGNRGLIAIVNDYGSTENGQLAKLMLANSYYYTRNFDMALKYYEDFGGSNKLLKVSALAGIAAVKEAKKDFSGAAKDYEKAANYDKENPFRDEHLFNAGKNYFMANDKENAKKIFDTLKKEYPKSKLLSQISRFNPEG